ncbi:putative heme exporter protein B [Marinomonas sp. MED121]|uniref:heme exporter protein CcmB n=1 Tax=Marinomonas sp. MED121 TaxID=314277 RepID=UPI0000690368|nr:heme exporter protein CcmB [Marinomonas sp. MED121]EAQ66197.1 putative heme exporter protein B [Marinomonas sp. MED121]
MTYSSFFYSEILAVFRRKQDVVNALVFFLLVITLFPLGVSPSKEFLQPAAGGIIWCAVALAVLMSVEGMFKEDFNDGSLEQLVVSGLYLPILVLLKLLVQWVSVIIPLLVLTPILSQMLFINWEILWVLVLTLLIGSPALFLIGTIGAALTVSLRRGAVLMLLIILPFYLPVIIFSTGAIAAAQVGQPYNGQLAILAAISLITLTLSPIMAAVSIKASVN